MKVTYDIFSDKGVIREINQDSAFAFCNDEERMSVFCIADGMGGHENGEKASDCITEHVRAWAEGFYSKRYNRSFNEMVKALSSEISESNAFIFREYNQGNSICGSTVVLLMIYDGRYAVFHLGDSRAYRKKLFGVECMTKDDTWENEAGNRETISKSEIKKRPEYGKLLRAVGVRATIYPHIQTGKLKDRESFMLCSDGVYKTCGIKDIDRAFLIARRTGEQSEGRNWIVKKAIDQGSTDNISCIFLTVNA